MSDITLKNTVSLWWVFDDAPEFMDVGVSGSHSGETWRNRAPQWLSASSCDPVRIAVASPTEPGWRSWKSQVEGKKSSGLEVFRTVPWFSYGTGGYILLSNPRAEPAPWRRSACCLLWASCFCRKILNQPRNVRGRWGQVAQPNAKTENCEVIHSVEKSKQSLSRIGRRRRDALSKVNRQSKSSRIKCPIQWFSVLWVQTVLLGNLTC